MRLVPRRLLARERRDLVEDLGHGHGEEVACVAHGHLLDDVEQRDLGVELLGEGEGIAEGMPGALGEVGGHQDLSDGDLHGRVLGVALRPGDAFRT